MKRWMWVPLAALVCTFRLLAVFHPAAERVPLADIPAAALPEMPEVLPVSVSFPMPSCQRRKKPLLKRWRRCILCRRGIASAAGRCGKTGR